MGIVPQKIQKLRTFASDFARAQGKEPVAKPAPEIEEAAPTPLPKPVTPAKVASVPKKPEPKTPTPPEPTTKEKVSETEEKPKLNRHVPLSRLGTLEENFPEVQANSILTTEDDVFDVMAADKGQETGNIITDQRRKRFRLIPATINMMREWFVQMWEKSTGETAGAKPEPEITDSEVLNRATKNSALAPSDDYELITQKRQQADKADPATKTFDIKDPEESTPSWTHVSEVGAEHSEIDPKVPANTAPLPEIKSQTDPSFEIPEEIGEVDDTFFSEAPHIPEAPTSKAEEVAKPTTDTVSPTETNSGLVYEAFTPPEQSRVQSAYRASSAPRLFTLRLIAVAIVAVVMGVGVAVWLFGQGNAIQTRNISAPEGKALVRADEIVTISLLSDSTAFMNAIQRVQPKTTTVIALIQPTVDTVGGTAPARTDEVLNTLDLSAPQSFQHAIEYINFGLYRDSQPFIVIKVTSFDVALSGMLSWESRMSNDLSPLFGPTVAGTFNPRARTATQIEAPYFYDTVVANTDVRLLSDELQKDRIIYSFIDRNTIVIATSKEAMSALISAL